MSHDETCKDIKSKANKYFPTKIISPFIKAVVDNDIHNDYIPERNFTIGELTDDERF